MLTLLQINVTANWGSTGRIAEEIGQTAMANGWESHIAYGRRANASTSNLIKIGCKCDVYTHYLRNRLFDEEGLGSKRATHKLIERIKDLNPDIIHLHNIHDHWLNYPVLFECLANINTPVIWTIHDCWAFTGHCAYYDSAGCRRWQTGCYDCPQREGHPDFLFLDHSTQNYAAKKKWFMSLKEMTLVPVSNWLAGEVQKSFLGKYPIKVIHNGIDTDVFSPCAVDKKKFGLGGKFVVLGVASVWSSRKGLSDFIELRKALPEDCVIVLIGLSQKQISSLPDGIVGISRTNNVQELVEYYSMADVYINTSIEETLGLTSIESQSCGTPTIVYNATACPETISSECGFVVEPHDISRLVEIVNHIRSQGKDKYSETCRHWAVEHFNKTDRFSEYIELYENILNEHVHISRQGAADNGRHG